VLRRLEDIVADFVVLISLTVVGEGRGKVGQQQCNRYQWITETAKQNSTPITGTLYKLAVTAPPPSALNGQWMRGEKHHLS